MATKTKVYDNTSIKSLKGADRVRKRPAVIFGSDGLDGCEQSIFEIISNSIDEAREGHGDKIIVTRYNDCSVEVEDFGRGIPVDYNENEKEYNWKLLFCELYAGGKYDNDTGANYEFSLGLNGLGLCATQYASEYMDVEVFRDGFRYELHFKKGNPVGKMIKDEAVKKSRHGTRICWRPDLKVFTEIDVPAEVYEDLLKRQAIVNAGVSFVFRNQADNGSFDTKTFYYANGIADYVNELAGSDAITGIQNWSGEARGRDREDLPDYNVRMSFALAFSNKTQVMEYYHNSSYLEHGGSPERAIKTAFVNQIDAIIRDRKLYRKNETKITFQDIQDCLIIISNSFSNVTSYENQTKKAITNKFIYQAMVDFLKRNLEVYFIENKMESDAIANQVLINKRSRENAEKTRLHIKSTMQASSDFTSRINKFVDCRSKDVAERELFIVEGDSALGACKQGRDAQFQAIMPVRGKILNCLKAEYDKIFKSDIITDLVKVLGCGVEVNSKANKDLSTFDIDNLRWNKVIICTDADVDGFQIRTLILTMIYRLMPSLIDLGYVYIAESPLYEITTRSMTYFAYDESERAEILEKIGSERYTLQRSKGLGENEPDMMWLTTMNPATRRLIKVTPADAEETATMFDILLGDNLAGRKEYIALHGNEYLEELDVS
ncbi:MAG: DNA topoisomerase [Oscillospiraceae bacterium]|nr:DNA topoisomerase [Oscillospiraceae bacterium]MBQ4000470.1 DNA topoisomerase [Oscillospiraceae bacterium]MBQ5412647.1 DNA topoisomerase [Oscillospiraceae bacterium]